MASKEKQIDDDESVISEEFPEGKMSLFHQLFAPGSLETDISEDSQFDSLGSASMYSDMSGSLDEEEEEEESAAEVSDTSTQLKMDRELRARHRSACKNMTVRCRL